MNLAYELDALLQEAGIVARCGWPRGAFSPLWPFLLALLLAGCATIPTAHRPYVAPAVLHKWVATGFPVERCRDMELRLQVYTDQQQLNVDCKAPPSRWPTWGCTEYVAAGFLGWSPYTLVRAIGNNPEHLLDWVIAHELAHAYAQCGLGEWDGGHTDRWAHAIADRLTPEARRVFARWLWSHWDQEQQRWVEGFEARAHEVLP